MYTYLEIRPFDKISPYVHRVDVTGKSERSIERIEMGMIINMNHNDFFIIEKSYETAQPKEEGAEINY